MESGKIFFVLYQEPLRVNNIRNMLIILYIYKLSPSLGEMESLEMKWSSEFLSIFIVILQVYYLFCFTILSGLLV